MALSWVISKLKQDIGRKSRFFHTPPSIEAFIGRESPPEYCPIVWHRNTRMVDLLIYQVVKNLTTCVAVSVQYRRVTNGQTDKHVAAT